MKPKKSDGAWQALREAAGVEPTSELPIDSPRFSVPPPIDPAALDDVLRSLKGVSGATMRERLRALRVRAEHLSSLEAVPPNLSDVARAEAVGGVLRWRAVAKAVEALLAAPIAPGDLS